MTLVKHDRFEANITSEALGELPFPADLANLLVGNMGYLTGGVPEENRQDMENVPVFAHDILVGHITYRPFANDKLVRVIIEDEPNSRDVSLAAAARIQARRSFSL